MNFAIDVLVAIKICNKLLCDKMLWAKFCQFCFPHISEIQHCRLVKSCCFCQQGWPNKFSDFQWLQHTWLQEIVRAVNSHSSAWTKCTEWIKFMVVSNSGWLSSCSFWCSQAECLPTSDPVWLIGLPPQLWWFSLFWHQLLDLTHFQAFHSWQMHLMRLLLVSQIVPHTWCTEHTRMWPLHLFLVSPTTQCMVHGAWNNSAHNVTRPSRKAGALNG